jgi:TolB-like protein/class 3 adenylate cyclase
MAEQSVTRKLAAIVATDMVGYSHLIEVDEEGTLARQKAHRQEIIDPKIAKRHGRIVKSTGDGLLVEFASAVDAVRCSIEVQRAMAEREARLPEDRRIQYRIGINLGDVVIDGDDIYGDGVNIAVRLQEIGEPGGVCISGTAYDQLKAKVEAGYEYLGERQVKNIAVPVRVYRALLDPSEAGKVIGVGRKIQRSWKAGAAVAALVVLVVAGGFVWWLKPWTPVVEPASVRRMAFPLPDKPSIAVLPFENMSRDPEQEYFSDGITEDIITDLSKIRDLFVIARNSTFKYKNKAIDVRQIGQELGVRHVIEGSVRKAGDLVRVTAQLVDTVNGDHLWAERYDHPLTNIFRVQDAIRVKIVASLDVQLAEGDQARFWRKTTDNIEAYDLFLRGRALHGQFNRGAIYEELRLMQQAVELDPEFAAAWEFLGWAHHISGFSGWSESESASEEKALECANRAIALDPSLGDAYSLRGDIYLMAGDIDRGIVELEKAVALSPNGSKANALLALQLPKVGRSTEALENIRRAIRLNPNPPDWFFLVLGRVHLFEGLYDEAIAALQECVIRLPDHISCRVDLTIAYMATGEADKARDQSREVLRINPKFSSSSWVTDIEDEAERKRRIMLLRKAGLPG